MVRLVLAILAAVAACGAATSADNVSAVRTIYDHIASLHRDREVTLHLWAEGPAAVPSHVRAAMQTISELPIVVKALEDVISVGATVEPGSRAAHPDPAHDDLVQCGI